jgi:PAS domain S-box-containing protein/putative nucleotidyltransferase with HDIG domain
MEKIQLAEILTSEVITVQPDTLVSQALRLMRNNNISCIIVVEDGKPVGIITERNVVKFIAESFNDSIDCEIREVMNSPVITAGSGMDIFEAYNLLSVNHMRHLAVVDASERLTGVVTLSNIVEKLTYESFVDMKRVSQVMTHGVYTVSRDTGVKQALVEMAEKAISCIVVVDGGTPVGIITERDVSRLHIDYSNSDLSRMPVDEVMTPSVQTVSADTVLPVAIDIMKRNKLRRLVVVDDDNGNIEGLATQSDIIKGLEGKYIQALNDIIKEKDSVIQNTTRDLAEKTIYLDNILDSAIEYGIIAINLNYQVIYFNSGAEQIFSIRAEAVMGQDVRGLHDHDQGLMGRVSEVLNTITNGERASFIIEREENEGKQYLSAQASGIIDKQKNLGGYFLMISDITKRKQAEDALQKANDELEQRVEKRTGQLKKATIGAIEAIALTVEMRDPYTSGHQRRVADLAVAIARKLGLSGEQAEGVYMAGLVHDIGKIRVPSGILCFPDKLSEAEIAIIKPHPEIGYNILKGIAFPWPLADIVRQHHERLDGSGYPQGLIGDQIIFKAKIIAVADVVEAMSSHRPYRPALGVERALEEITTNRGKLYDPEVVDACVSLFEEDDYSLLLPS